MSEIRLDFITKRPVIFTNVRENKPTDLWDSGIMSIFKKFDDVSYSPTCPFCKGNEHLTTQNIYGDTDDWNVKIVPNMYPIVQNELDIKKVNKFCYFSSGIHDVIVETPYHNETYFTMSKEHFYEIYSLIHKRYVELINDKHTTYVSLFKNYKMLGGASMQHSHSQILCVDATPIKLNNEIESAKKYYDENKSCHFCEMLEYEKNENVRVLCENEDFVAIAPYASMYKYEMHIYPKKHISSFEEETNILSLSEILHKVFAMLYKTIGDFPFNMYLSSLLKTKKDCKESYHYSFRIIPKLSGSAGFEMSSGIRVNSVYPEVAIQKILEKNK